MVVWQSDPLSGAGLTLEVALGAAYFAGVRRADRHRRWPRSAVASFTAGLVSLAIVLQSGLAAYDEIYAVHVVQHVVLMSVAPPLLALGAPMTLLLRVAPAPTARRVVAFLHSRPARGLCGRTAAVHVPLDYYGLMFLFLLAPVQQLTSRNDVAHVASHLLLLTCGLLFWVPMVGRDVTGWRPSDRSRLAHVGAGVPVNAVLAAVAGSWWLLAVSEAAVLLGLAVVIALTRSAALREQARQQRRLVTPTAVQV
jgi:putative membrane protein